MTTICDRCDLESDVAYCWRHNADECDVCADICRANGTWALRGIA